EDTLGGLSIVKLKTKFAAMLSGGSFESASVTCAANTVTVQSSPLAKSVSGFTVKVVFGLAETTDVCAPLVAQEIVTGVAPRFTDSLNVIETFELLAICVAPLVGVVALTVGAASIEKLKTKFAAMLSGGSPASVSVTCAARTVTVHVS